MADAAGAPSVTSDEVVSRAAALRPRLLEEQAATESRGYYSEELHEAFRDAGFYRILVPRRYGGLELDVPTFYRVISSIARGCPSTGWMLALGSGHALQVASYFSEQAQDDLFSDGDFIASASFAFQDAHAEPLDDGYRVSGTWHFCSGVPYASHPCRSLRPAATRTASWRPPRAVHDARQLGRSDRSQGKRLAQRRH